MKVLIRKLAARILQLSPLTITAIGLLYMLAVGAVDSVCPPRMMFTLFYLLGVAFVARCSGNRTATFVISLASVAVLTSSELGKNRVMLQRWVEVWTVSTSLVVFVATGWLIVEITRLTRNLGRLVEERTLKWKTEAERHKQTSARLAEAIERFEQVINNITQVFWLTDVPKSQMVYISPGYEHLWGRKCEELYRDPRSWAEAVHPDDREEIIRRALTEQVRGAYEVEYRILRPDGSLRWIRDRAFPVRSARGEVYRIAGLAEDITERKQTREVLQTQAAILENMAEGVVVTDEKGLIVQMNPAAERIWGYKREEVIGQSASVFSALPEPKAAAVMCGVLADLQTTGSWRGTFENRRKDGAIISCEAVMSRLEVQSRVLMVAVEQDVTERQRAQEQLQMQARVLECMAEAVLVVDENGLIVFTNPALDAMLGYERGELSGQPMLVVNGHSPEEHRRYFQRNFEQVRAHGSTAGEYLARRKDGTLIEVATQSSGASIGNRFCLVVVGQDITERKRAEQALRQSEETLRVFLDANPEPAFLADRDGRILVGNQVLARRLGIPKGELVGKYAFSLIPPKVAETRKAMFDRVIRSRQPLQYEDSRESRHLLNFDSPVLDTAGNVTRVAVFALDITERKRGELTKEAFLSLGAKLSAARSPVEVAWAISATLDPLWKWDSGALELWQPHSDQIETVLVWDVVDGRRREVAPGSSAGPPTARTRRVMGKGAELILRKQGDMPETDLVPFGDISRRSASIMCVPVRAEDQAVGVLSIQSYTPNAYTQEDLRTLQVMADYCAGAIKRLRVEETVRQREELNRAILATAMDGYYILDFAADPGGAIIDINDAFCRMSGYSREELLQMRMTDLEAGESPEDLARHCQKIMAARADRFETRHRRKDGQEIQVEISASLLAGGEPRNFGFVRDITQRKQAEKALREVYGKLEQRVHERTAELQAANRALRESEARLRLTLDASNAGTWSWDTASNIATWDDRYRELYGFEPHDPQSHEAWICRVHPEDRERILARIQTLIEPGTGDTWNEEFRALHPVKGERWMGGLGRVERDQVGRAVRFVGINLDITERKHAEQAQHAQLVQIEAIYQSAPVGLCVLDENLRYVRVNERLATMNGMTVEQHIGRTVREAVPHLADGADAICRQVIATGQPMLNLELEGTTEAQRGVLRTWVTHWVPLKQADGRVTGISVVIEEVTERKRAEEAQRAELQYIETIYQNAPVGLCALDLNLRYVRINERLATMNGMPVERHIGRTVREALPRLADGIEAICRQVSETGQPVLNREFEGQSDEQPGVLRTAVTHWMPLKQADGRVTGISVVVDEVTERKRVDQALRDSEVKYRRLHESMRDAFVSVEMSGRISEFNPAYQALLGYSTDELRSLTYVDLTPEKWHAMEARIVAEQILPRGYSDVYEKEYRRKDGTIFPVEMRTYLIRDTHGQPAEMWAIARDITERKRTEEALREARDTLEARVKERTAELQAANAALAESEERYRSLVNNLNVGVYRNTLGPHGRFIQANPALARMHGYDSVEEFQKVRVADLYQQPGERKEFVAEMLRRGSVVNHELRLKKKDGTAIYGSANATVHRGPNGEADWIDGTIEDITERKRAEQQLGEALDLNQKIIAASTMGIAAYRASGECVFANESLARTVGGSIQEVLQGNFRHLESWRKSGLLEMAEETLSQGQARRGEIYTATRFDKGIWLDCHTAPVVSNGQPHLLIMALDITERKHSESLLQAQRDLGVSFSLTTDLNAALKRLLEIIVQIGGVDCGGVHLLNQATGEMDLAAERGGSPRFIKTVSHWAPDSPQMRLVLKNRPVFSLYRDLPIRHDELHQREGLRAAAIIPLSHEGRVFGTLALASHVADEIPRQTQLALEAIASQAAGAIARIQAEESLRESEIRLRAIISNAPVLIFAVDQDGIIRFEDGQALKALGATRGANVGRSVMEVYAHVPAILENARRALRGEEFESIVEAGPVTLDCWYSPTRDREGKPAGYIGVATNITERYRLEHQILEISDREHARIGQDIHDGLCQHLVTLAFDANSLRRELATRRRPEAKMARRMADYLDQAITEARQLSRGLFPVRLETEGLPPALEELAKATRDRFRIRCRFDSEGLVTVKDNSVATHLYRIAQEAVANAAKHSQARRVSIRLRARADQIELRVEDDGAGLSSAARSESTGMGLHIMDYRARTIGGTLHVGAGRRGGTVVSCCVPCARQ